MKSLHMDTKPSDWIMKQIKKIKINKESIKVLDFASGNGRHSIPLANEKTFITAIDKNQDKLDFYKDHKNIRTICFDLETNEKWPLIQNEYDIVLVTNYLYRPRIKDLTYLVNENGYLLYETFSEGNEKFGKPSNTNYLLKENELIYTFKNDFNLIEYFNGMIKEPKKMMMQRCCLKKKTV